MKRHGHLFEQIMSKENLSLALTNACRSNGRTSPAKKKAVEDVRANPEKWQQKLGESIENYAPSKYECFPLYDPKLRFIYALPFVPDRLVHHALINILSPIWDRLMSPFSFACRINKGQHKAGTLCAEYVRRYKYVAQFDISQFYVSINHRILKGIVRHKIKDERVLHILDRIIDSISTRDENLRHLYTMRDHGVKHKDIEREIKKLETSKERDNQEKAGLPVGSYTSQWLGNLYLNENDTYLKQTLRCKAVVRYCDDFLIFSNDKAFLQKVKELERDFLWNELHLILSKAEVYPTAQGVDFCGYRYFPEGYVLLRKSTAKRQKKTIQKIAEGFHNGEILREVAQNRLASIGGWLRWAKCHNFKKSSGYYEIYKEVCCADT